MNSICVQTVLPDEVLIGDDGSTADTAQLIESMRKEVPFSLVHVWHEDKFMYNKEKNFDYYASQNEQKAIRCKDGV